MHVMNEPDWSPPRAFHRVCARHFVSNFNVRVTNRALKSVLMRLCYLPQKKKDDVGSVAWLEALPIGKWALSHDEGGRRWGAMTTNGSECFNNVLVPARDLPITALVNYTFRQANDIFIRRRDQHVEWKGKYAPKIEKAINAARQKSLHHEVEMYDREHIVGRVVTAGKRNIHTVDFRTRSCSCGKWELFRYPCSHVLAVCMHEHMSIMQCVAPEYYISREVWGNLFNPLPDPAYWPLYDGPKHVPNESYKRTKRGRPPSRRRLNEMDGRLGGSSSSQVGTSASQSTSTTKVTRTQKCSKCHAVGHNKKSCVAYLHED